MDNNLLKWHKKADQLHLQGELQHNSLLPLWQQRAVVMQGVREIDVSQLTRVDSAGLALLLHLLYADQLVEKAVLVGKTEKLQALLTLYNLQSIMPIANEQYPMIQH